MAYLMARGWPRVKNAAPRMPPMSYYRATPSSSASTSAATAKTPAPTTPAQAGFDRCKSRVKAEKLAGPGGVRVNKAGCLDRCAGGPVAVVYPEATWYTFVDADDIDEIVDSHLKNGQVVQRLVLPPDVAPLMPALFLPA